ncbi:MAG: SpoIIIAH-like family protein [Acutalibacteraceae bacterium]
MKFGKRQLVLAAMVVALGAAVYLNWQFSDGGLSGTQTVKTTSKELGQAEFVNNSTDGTVGSNSNDKQQSNENTGKTAKSIETSAEYFAKCKVERQQAQDEITDAAKEILEAASSDEETKEKALQQAADLATHIEQQSNIESLIKAKGFSQCFVFIQNEECSVVVCKGELTDDGVIVIKDIVNGQSGIEFEKIKITEA